MQELTPLQKLIKAIVEGTLSGLTIAGIIIVYYLIIRYPKEVETILAIATCCLIPVLGVGFFIAHVLGLPRTSGYRGSDGVWYGRD